MGITDKIAALVLAAGYSSRMQAFKPLLPLGDVKVIESTISTLKRAGINDITVVTGHHAAKLEPVLAGMGIYQVFNESYDQGMFSSIVKGVQSLSPEIKGFFLLPGDMPFVKSHTVKLLCRAFSKSGGDVIYPVFQKYRGHPPLIASSCFPEILSGKAPGGLREILARHEAQAYDIEVLDEGVLLDLDTYEEYECKQGYRRDIPTQAECEELLVQMQVPEPIKKHGQMVAAVAQKLAIGLNKAGLCIDVEAVIIASNLHDVAKGQPDHARRGAKILKKYGYNKVADIVGAHTDLDFAAEGLPDEAAVVYLADKLVRGENIVSLAERFSTSMEKYASNGEAVAAVIKRRLKAQMVEKAVEGLLGVTLAQVIEQG